MPEYTVSVAHDTEAGIWYVEMSDIEGLNAEAGSYEDLVDIVLDLAPDLVQAEGGAGGPALTFPVHVVQHAMAIRTHA